MTRPYRGMYGTFAQSANRLGNFTLVRVNSDDGGLMLYG